MFNQDFFEKVCRVECTFAELEAENLEEMEYDYENPFEKYYKLENILLAIQKYQKHSITAQHLAYWANTYNWIINGGFKTEEKKTKSSLEQIILWEISDTLDALSFFDGKRYYNLKWFSQAFSTLDLILHSLEKWQVHYTFSSYGNSYILLTNEELFRYVLFAPSYEEEDEILQNFEKLEIEEMKQKIKSLKKLHFKDLKCSKFDPNKY